MNQRRDDPRRETADGRPSPTILVVEDEALLAEFYSGIFEDDFEVRVATDGSAALDALGPSVDIVLLDRNLPEVAGAQILETIRDQLQHCYVAFLTGQELTLGDADLDFDAYLLKPVDPQELRSVVDELLERDRYSQDVRKLFATDAKLKSLEAAIDEETLESSDVYTDLLSRRHSLERELWTALEEYLERRHESNGTTGVFSNGGSSAEFGSRSDTDSPGAGPGGDRLPSNGHDRRNNEQR